MDQLPPAESPHPSPAYSGDRQQTSRLCISSVLSEESLEVEAANILTSPATVGSTRGGSICGSHIPSATSIRELEVGPTRTSDRCSDNSMGSIQESIYKSAVKSSHANSAEDQRATSESGDTSGSSLAVGHLVPPVDGHGDGTYSLPGSEQTHHAKHPIRSLPLDKSQLEALRLETVRNHFEGQGYSQATVHSLIKTVEEQTGPRSPYLNPNMFTQFELNNFLTDTVAAGYSLSAVQIFRAAVCLLHKDPEHVRHSTNLKALLKHSKHTAPPKQLLEPTVDITPRLCFLAEIPSDKSARLVDLNKKTAFLLVMAADQSWGLGDQVVATKELRAGRRIVKSLSIRKNDNFKEMRPVRTFIALKSHPAAVKRPCNKLLVNSKNPAKLLRTTTISTWLRNLMRLSTSQKPIPSVRLVASDLALARGAPLSDVVTMRNWPSTDVFNNHYR
ncbi:unnamed protein product [Umbelopsis vinacea]